MLTSYYVQASSQVERPYLIFRLWLLKYYRNEIGFHIKICINYHNCFINFRNSSII